MIKVLIIAASELPIPAYKGGATETLTEHMLKCNNREDVIFTVYSRCNYSDFEEGNVIYKFLPKTWIDRVMFRILWLFRQLTMRKLPIPDFFPYNISKKVNLNEYDVVVLEGNKDQVLTLKRVFKGKIILHIHTVMTFTKEILFAKKTYDQCDVIIANSQYSKDVMTQINPNESMKIQVLHNAIDLDEYSPKKIVVCEEIRKNIGIEKEEFLFIFSGRLEQGKGVLELIKAFKKLDFPCKLIIVGSSWYGENKESPYITLLKQEASAIKDKIIFTGYVEHSMMPAYYQACDVAIMPSVYNEAAGLVAIEAQASGIPVIVSEIGGIPEYVNAETSLKVQVDENFVDNLADKMSALYYDTELYKKEKLLAEESCRRFDIKRYSEEYLQILRGVISK